jgi:hypothetical protein
MDKKITLERFKSFLKKQIKIEEKRAKSGHMSWGIGDVEHHDPEKPEVRENQVSMTFHSPEGGYNKDYWSNQHGGLKDPKTPEEKSKIDAENHAAAKKYTPHEPDINQHDLSLEGGHAEHPVNPVNRDHDYLEGFTHDHDTVKNTFSDHVASLDVDQKHAVHTYKGDSEPFNKHLRDTHGRERTNGSSTSYDDDEYRANKIKNMEKATNHPIPHDLHVFRGMHSPEFKSLPKGSQFTDHGFTGTSLSPDIAKSFSHSNGGDMFHIHAPAGSKGHYLNADPNAGLEHEKEFLLHRGTRFEVTGHSRVSDPYDSWRKTHVTHLKVIGQKDFRG